MTNDPEVLDNERDFLFRSLDDLDAEHADGNLDDATYERLKLDYTARAARVLHQLDGEAVPVETGAPVKTGRRVLVGLCVLTFAVAASVALAYGLGARLPGQTITGQQVTTKQQQAAADAGLKQLQADPWTKVEATYAPGQVCPGRVTRLADFGAFVELQPGVEALAHLSTFPPTGSPEGWKASVRAGMTASFQILSVELEKKRIGVALVADGMTASAQPVGNEIVPGARLTGKVERHEKFGVFVFLAPGRTGLIPMKETGVAREADIARTFPIGSEVEVLVL